MFMPQVSLRLQPLFLPNFNRTLMPARRLGDRKGPLSFLDTTTNRSNKLMSAVREFDVKEAALRFFRGDALSPRLSPRD